MTALDTPPRKTSKVRAAMAIAGLILGGGIGYLTGKLLAQGHLDAARFGWSDGLAAVLAASLVAGGLVMALATFSAKAAGRLVDPGSDRPATPVQRAFYRQQALVVALAGAMLGAPLMALAAFDPMPQPIAIAVMLAVVAAFLVQTVYNLVVYRTADELLKQVVAETGAACFWILQGLLFLWACAEKLNLAPALSAWDLMTLMMAFYLVVASLMSIRRGLT